MLLARFQSEGIGEKKFRFKNKLISLDSTIIDLAVSLFNWAYFHQTKGAIKLHFLLDHDGYLFPFAWITEGKVADIKIARQMIFPLGPMVVDDRAYNDYRLFAQWTSQGGYFLAKMKENALYEVLGERDFPQTRNILQDELIQFTGYGAGEKCPHPLRSIEVYDPKPKESISS